MKSHKLIIISWTIAAVFGVSQTAAADEGMLMSMVKDMQKQMNEMQKTIDLQSVKIKKLEGKEMEYKPAGDFKENLKASIGDADKWLKDLKFSGDFRLRYEAQSEHGATNSPDRNRFRFRLRYGFVKSFDGPFHEDDKMKVGFRLASAGTTAGNITSTNTTLDSQFTNKALSINRAYASYYPGWAKLTTDDGLGLTGIEVTAGKFKNPFRQGSTWMMWDSDVEPEGLYEQFKFDVAKTDDFGVKNTSTLGQLIVEEGGGVDHDDAELFAYQTVFETKIKDVLDAGDIKLKNAVSFYNFNDFGLPGNFGAAGNNTLSATGAAGLATSFNVLDFYNEIGLPFSVHKAKGFKLYFDWMKNVSGDGLDIENGGDDKAWLIGAKLGKAKKKGTWELKYEYAWAEENATPDIFNDGDFSVSTTAGGTAFGGSNTRGSVIKGKYALTDNFALGLSLFRMNSIAGPDDAERALYQADLIWKF